MLFKKNLHSICIYHFRITLLFYSLSVLLCHLYIEVALNQSHGHLFRYNVQFQSIAKCSSSITEIVIFVALPEYVSMVPMAFRKHITRLTRRFEIGIIAEDG